MGSVKLKFHILWFLEIILKFFWWLRVLCFFPPLFFISGSPAKDFSGFVLLFSSLFISSAWALLCDKFLQLYFLFLSPLHSILSVFSSPSFLFYSHLTFIFFILFHFRKICNTFLYFSQDTNNNFFSKIKEVSDHEFERSKRWGPWDKLEEERWERNNYNLIKIFFRLVYPFNWICYILFILH